MKMNLTLGHNAAGMPLLWNEPRNGHAFITGTSGSGKSYFLKTMIPQLADQGFRVLIFDCSSDFTSAEGGPPDWPPKDIDIMDLHDARFGVDPFRPSYEGQRQSETANAVADMLKVSLRLGDAQWAFISSTIEEGMDMGVLHRISDLVDVVASIMEGNDAAKRIYPKLKKLKSIVPDGDPDFDWELDRPGTTVIDLHHCDASSQAILIELLLGTICSGRMATAPSEEYPVVLVFDECQRLSLRPGSWTNRILREGRKFGLSGWFSTQWISDPEEQKAMDQAALRVYFRPDAASLHKTVLRMGLKDREQAVRYESILAKMKCGCFMFRDGNRYKFNKV